jgi:hypothetical protein
VIHIVISCDAEYGRYGLCPASVRVFGVASVDEALERARPSGWSRRRDGRVECPRHGRNMPRGPSIISVTTRT